MAIHVALNHVTHYRYDRLVKLSPQVIRLRPAPHCRTAILAYSLKAEPKQHFINWQQDPFSNYLARLVFPEATREFKVTVDLVAELAVHNPFDFFLEPFAETYPFAYDTQSLHELAPYLVTSTASSDVGARFKQLLDQLKKQTSAAQQRTVEFLVALNQRLTREIGYVIRLEPGVQTPEETLQQGSGSCRDSAWLLVQILRHLGLAARFVSGYLIQLKADVKALDGPSGTDQDFTDLHAWCEVYLPGAGWVGLDPTSGLLAGEGHIPVAATPQPSSAAPISGVVDFSEVEFSHHMQVTRVFESPRVTQPYSETQWQSVLNLGEQVDRDLDKLDVRLTQGGEPTFVAVQDRDGVEWNTTALGPTKRKYAVALLDKLRTHYGANGFVHFGQGKWYPGEQLPRWALSIYWRSDGQACWQDLHWLADESSASSYTPSDAENFITCLAQKLGLARQYIHPAYEDIAYYLWRERRLPINLDPLDARLKDELERAQLRKVFTQELGAIVGYVLPLRVDERYAQPRWLTGKWHFRDGHLFLVPGDSPMGYRLPLDSLPWAAEKDLPVLHPADPFAEPVLLQDGQVLRQRYAVTGEVVKASEEKNPQRFESASWLTRTALCAEVRQGHLYVFMPPLTRLNDYLDLLAALEATACELELKIVLEGYTPPRDPRLKVLQITPDPGVIEVNIHPASNWQELVDHTEFLYQAAHQTRLSSEKFMLDGRHTGTGGGNHFVLGGATAADSPFLRRPDLLTSLVAYWHNHPALSYLFSGLFIGPTSQAPRVDEARNDQLYELEIALNQIHQQLKQHETCAPWLIDRSLRNILIDVTGNTHRAEFSIDKLYSPDSATGRLGLLELRAFEMPPHARMSLVQQLLLRALVARFWQQPYWQPGVTQLTRWGATLHDRFLLPTWVAADFDDVLRDLRAASYDFDPAWFAAHFEFRFPLVGEVVVQGVKLSIRNALEPWHVMGEENAPGGTVRYVDSSLERLEVKVSGLNDQRYVVTVNGYPLPLQATGIEGEYVAGVRYRAWSAPSALHPTIGVHVPLIFDVVDTWTQRSLGGCQYHVAHPGGRHYDTFPVNAYEAESRRLARFFKMGHSAGKMTVKTLPVNLLVNREFPCTLDLRRCSE